MWEIYLNFILLGINIVLWWYKFHWLDSSLKLLGVLVLTTFIAEGYAFYLHQSNTNNLFIFHILVPSQYLICALIFYIEIQNRQIRKGVLGSCITLFVLAFAFAFSIQKLNEYNSYVAISKHFFLVLCILFYYRQIMVNVEMNNPLQEPMFWISTGLLFYSLGNFFIEGYMNILIEKSMEMARRLYFVNVLLGLFMYILFIIGFLKYKKPSLGIESGK